VDDAQAIDVDDEKWRSCRVAFAHGIVIAADGRIRTSPIFSSTMFHSGDGLSLSFKP